MRHLRRFPVLAVLVVFALATAAACNSNNSASPGAAVADVAEEAMDSVVRIGVNCPPDGPLQLCEGSGSGWAYDDDGHIITNNHVIMLGGRLGSPGAIVITTPDGRNFRASVVGRDPQTDLALLRIEDDHEPLSPLPHGSLEDTRIGEPVVAIGYALDLGASPSVTSGVVSAKERSIIEAATGILGALQTDAAINPGNSGGPLLNLDGEVIGVNTAQALRAEAIGFAVSIETTVAVANELLEMGRVRRGFIGIAFQDVTPGLAQQFGLAVDEGVRIEAVGPGTPAADAGLEAGDVIVELDDVAIRRSSDLPLAIIGNGPGDTVQVRAWRGGDQFAAEVQLAEIPN